MNMSAQQIEKQLEKEVRACVLEQFLVLLPGFLIILVNADYTYLVLPVLLGIILDFIRTLSKKFWIATSIITMPLTVLVYFFVGQGLNYINITLPAASHFSEETILYAFITARFILSFIKAAGGVLEIADFKKKDLGNAHGA